MKKFDPFKRKKNIKYPFSSNKRGPDTEPQDHDEQEIKKTQIGLQADLPYLDKSEDSETIIKCPDCEYPLRVEPSASSPCPNCGFSGSKAHVHDTVSDSGKTIKVGSLDMIDDQKAFSLKFILFDESLNSEIKIESEETELILNRDHLDPNNMSISGDQHVEMKIKDGNIYISDVSSNGSTFIHVKDKTPISFGTRLVLGNKIFLFNSKGNTGQPSGNPDGGENVKATMKIGQFDVQDDPTGSIVLIEESTGQTYSFQGEEITVNRSSIDPENPTISSKKHALLSFESGSWHVQDVSTNGATFRQVSGEMKLTNNTKLIIGNKVFRFEY